MKIVAVDESLDISYQSCKSSFTLLECEIKAQTFHPFNICKTFKNMVCSWKKTQHIIITKKRQLMLCRATISDIYGVQAFICFSC